MDFELLMANIRNQVNEYVDHMLLKCCKEYNLPFHEVRKKLGIEQDVPAEKEDVCENTVSVNNNKPTKKPKNVTMCAALTRNGDPCKSKATDNETYCKKHLASINKEPAAKKQKQPAANKQKEPAAEKQKEPGSNKRKKTPPPPKEVTVNDLPNDEAEWLVNDQVGTIPPDLSMTKSFYPSEDLIYEDDTVIDDVSESEYVLDE